eukprot:63816-Rhodomonas_salina.2
MRTLREDLAAKQEQVRQLQTLLEQSAPAQQRLEEQLSSAPSSRRRRCCAMSGTEIGCAAARCSTAAGPRIASAGEQRAPSTASANAQHHVYSRTVDAMKEAERI